MKNKPYLYYINNPYSKKRLLLIGILILILIFAVYFIFFNKQTKPLFPVVETIPQYQKTFLDDRFLVLYGKISSIDSGLLNIEVIKNQKFTDYVFNGSNNIDLLIEGKTIIKKIDLDTNIYRDISIEDIKKDNFITAYIQKATSSGYKAIGVKIFNKNIIE